MLEIYIDSEFIFELEQRTDSDDEIVFDFIYIF